MRRYTCSWAPASAARRPPRPRRPLTGGKLLTERTTGWRSSGSGTGKAVAAAGGAPCCVWGAAATSGVAAPAAGVLQPAPGTAPACRQRAQVAETQERLAAAAAEIAAARREHDELLLESATAQKLLCMREFFVQSLEAAGGSGSSSRRNKGGTKASSAVATQGSGSSLRPFPPNPVIEAEVAAFQGVDDVVRVWQGVLEDMACAAGELTVAEAATAAEAGPKPSGSTQLVACEQQQQVVQAAGRALERQVDRYMQVGRVPRVPRGAACLTPPAASPRSPPPHPPMPLQYFWTTAQRQPALLEATIARIAAPPGVASDLWSRVAVRGSGGIERAMGRAASPCCSLGLARLVIISHAPMPPTPHPSLPPLRAPVQAQVSMTPLQTVQLRGVWRAYMSAQLRAEVVAQRAQRALADAQARSAAPTGMAGLAGNAEQVRVV